MGVLQMTATANATEHNMDKRKNRTESFRKAEQHQSATLNIISGVKKEGP